MIKKHTYLLMPILAMFIMAGLTGTVFAQTDSNLPEFLNPVITGAIEASATFGDSIVKVIGATIILVFTLVVGKSVEKGVKVIIGNLVKVGQKNEQLKNIIGVDDTELTNPRNLIPITLKWFVYVIGIIASVNALGFIELSNALTNLWVWIPNILASVVILVLGTILVRFILKWVLERKFFGTDDNSGKVLQTVIKVIVYSVIVAIAITQLGIGEDVIPILVQAFAYGLAGAFTLAIGLGLWKVVPIWVQGKDNERLGIKKGTHIKVFDTKGTPLFDGNVDIVGVTKVRLVSNGKVRLIPHSMFSEETQIEFDEKSN